MNGDEQAKAGTLGSLGGLLKRHYQGAKDSVGSHLDRKRRKEKKSKRRLSGEWNKQSWQDYIGE